MERKQILVGPHGGHNFIGGDDGLTHPWKMVKAAHEAGIVPAQTSHNTMQGIPDYLQAMDHYFGRGLALPGVELSFRITNLDPEVTSGLHLDDNFRFLFPPPVQRFIRGTHHKAEKSRMLKPSEIQAARDEIETCAVEIIGKPIEEVRRILKPGLAGEIDDFLMIAVNYERIESDLRNTNPKTRVTPEDVFEIITGLKIALNDPRFPAYLALFNQLIETGEIKAPDAHNPLSRTVMICVLALDYHVTHKSGKHEPDISKGEIICLMPPEIPLLRKVAGLVEYWRKNDFHIKGGLSDIFAIFKDHLTDGEYKTLLWYLPHPVSIDINFWGKAILRGFEKGIGSLFAPEIFIPQNAAEIHAIEVYNAAHPGLSNQVSGNIASIDLFRNKAKAGASDSHHPTWVPAGATLIAPHEMSSYGILDSFKRGETLPISGLGERSLSWRPFPLWLMNVPIFHWDLVPNSVRRRVVGRKIDIATPAQKAIREGLIFQRNNIEGWVY